MVEMHLAAAAATGTGSLKVGYMVLGLPTESLMSQAGLELTLKLKKTLNSRSSWLLLPRVEITGGCYPARGIRWG